MATRIRLSRKGRCHVPMYRVVVADSRSPRDGKFLAQLGTYNPTVKPAEVKFEVEAVLDWLSRGALPSDTVRSLLKRAGVWAIFEAKRKGQDAVWNDDCFLLRKRRSAYAPSRLDPRAGGFAAERTHDQIIAALQIESRPAYAVKRVEQERSGVCHGGDRIRLSRKESGQLFQ